jgi:hypothetical protein
MEPDGAGGEGESETATAENKNVGEHPTSSVLRTGPSPPAPAEKSSPANGRSQILLNTTNPLRHKSRRARPMLCDPAYMVPLTTRTVIDTDPRFLATSSAST